MLRGFDYRTERQRRQAEDDHYAKRKKLGDEPPRIPAEAPRGQETFTDYSAGTTDDVEMAPSGERSMAAGRTDGSETSVDPFRHYRLLPFNDTQNCIMPYQRLGSLTIAAGTNNVATLVMRLNSIYDIMTIDTFVPNPTPAADVADASVQKPMLYNYWTTLYRYWTVVGSRYKLRVWLDSRTEDQEVSVWTYHNGAQQPPCTLR